MVLTVVLTWSGMCALGSVLVDVPQQRYGYLEGATSAQMIYRGRMVLHASCDITADMWPLGL